MSHITPIVLGLIINTEKRKYVIGNDIIPIELTQDNRGRDVMVTDRASLTKLRDSVDKLLAAFP